MTEQTIKVWDPLVRLFHWALVVSFAVAWLTADDWKDLHEWAGYVAAALIVFRLVWGFTGSRYARFSQFLRSPGTVLEYVRATAHKSEPRFIGHNPAGSVMIVLLIVAMGATALTGWMYTLDAFWGVDWVENLHELGAEAMLVLVVVHVLGVIYASHAHHENLVRAMITGRKRAADKGDIV